MANISAQLVKELRDMTGAKMMDCKKALVQTEGDIDKAVEFLREKGLADAAKKSGRVAAEGIVKTYISEDKKKGAVVEFNCETDFVAINDEFMAFADRLAQMAVETSATTVEELVNEKFDAENTVSAALKALIAKLGENMTIRRFTKFGIENGIVKSYIHGGGRIGVLVELACDTASDVLDEVAKEVCMQIAAANPLFLSEKEVDNTSIEKEKEIYRVQALNEGKPEKIVEKMVEGRIKKYYKEVCLLDQLWVKDSDKTIAKFLEEKSKEVGSPITVTRFVRYERGEGIEVEKVDFAEEVARQMGK
ncbi:translation elongation factor Ts [Clostridium saccharobutylicum]|uniref:Elongation factor Ts n=1 Tax=Clostridium saccharobutylicum TaxID=169679 RepID=A0A1S8NB36_CLOSA|nr:translation elongation factor Ts [Clostridium saccharobutylicum]OOM13696.1 elongation factor Ts [Clostridium saccharobutylicum]